MSETQMERVHTFIQATLRQQGYPPNIEEISSGCALAQAEVVTCLDQLDAAGRLAYRPERPRGMRLATE